MSAAYGLGMFAYSIICLAIGCTIIYFVIKNLKGKKDNDEWKRHRRVS